VIGTDLRTRAAWCVVALSALGVTFTGCAAKVSTRGFEVVAAPDANRHSPIPVDLVLVRTDALAAIVTGLSAKQWFAQRSQLLKDHPGDLEYRSWEFVPGKVSEIDRFPFDSRKGIALVVFADYLSEGAHRLRVDPMKKFRLTLSEEGFQAESIR
jgi:type VI secretion system protein